MNLRQSVGAVVHTIRETVIYAKYKIIGSSYAEYYAERMDGFINRKPNWGLERNKEFQLNYLVKNGLKKEAQFLDLGCGAVNAGLFFIDYLNPGCYTGSDVSKNVLVAGEQRIKERNLTSKKPTLVHTPAGDLTALGNKKFDVVWAQSVLTHMPPEDIKVLFKDIQKYMSTNSAFYFTITRCETGHQQHKFKDWFYSIESIMSMLQEADLSGEIMKDWIHPDDAAGVDTLFKITRK